MRLPRPDRSGLAMTKGENHYVNGPPLKIRGAGGVMKTVEVTPFNPPYSKGEISGKSPYLKRGIQGTK